MAVLFVGLEDGLMRVDVNGTATAQWAIEKGPVMNVVVDPGDAKNVYAAISGSGVFRSDDNGRTFEAGANQFRSLRVWSLAVSATERTAEGGVIYAGTMPSAAYRSDDGGRNWRELTAFQDVPGQENWSFPPQPTTHLIHQLAVPVTEPQTVLAGIELGGVVKSTDGGESWAQVAGAGDDCHTLVTHPDAPGRYYESDGAGYVESKDYGKTWKVTCEGIPDAVRYFYSMAVDPGDPENIIISASRDQYSGHALRPNTLAFDRNITIDFAVWSTLYRKQGDAEWREVLDGLPDPYGSPLGRLATNPAEGGVFYYWTVDGELYRSADGGDHWDHIEIAWPDGAQKRIVHSAAATAEA
jgi:hypothetical protein